MDIKKDLIPVLTAHGIGCRRIMSPRGPALDLAVDRNGRTFKLLLLHYDDDIKSIETVSSLAVEPMQYDESFFLLNYVLNHGRKRVYRWRLLENGQYYLTTSEWAVMEQPIDIPAVISKLIDTFSTFEPFIEELARGTKRECAEVHDELKKLKLIK